MPPDGLPGIDASIRQVMKLLDLRLFIPSQVSVPTKAASAQRVTTRVRACLAYPGLPVRAFGLRMKLLRVPVLRRKVLVCERAGSTLSTAAQSFKGFLFAQIAAQPDCVVQA